MWDDFCVDTYPLRPRKYKWLVLCRQSSLELQKTQKLRVTNQSGAEELLVTETLTATYVKEYS